MKRFKELREKAVSQQQQKLMGLALAYKRGEASDDEVSDQVKKMADSMSTKDLEDFAKTKHKDLPKKVDEYGGPPISRKDYLKQKPMEESKNVEKAIQIAKDMGGNMTGAYEKIEKISRGLSKHPKVKDALRLANEMTEEVELDEEQKLFMFNNKSDAQKKAKEIRGKVLELGPKNFAVVTKDLTVVREAKADFIRLTFNSLADKKKAVKWMFDNLPSANQGFTGISVGKFKDIEFEGVDDADALMSKLKKAGFKFKVDHRESVSEAKMSVGDTVRISSKSKNIVDRKKLGKSGYIKSIRGQDYLVKFADGSSVLAKSSDLEGVNEEVELEENFIRSLRQVAQNLGLRGIAWKLLDMEKDKAAEKITQSDIDGFVKDAEEVLPMIGGGYQRHYKSLINKLKKAKGREALRMMEGIAHYISRIKSNAKMRNEEILEAKNEVEVSLRDARKAVDLAKDMFRGEYKMDGSNVFVFKNKEAKQNFMTQLKKHKLELNEEDQLTSKSFWDIRESSRNARSDARSAMQDDPDMKQKFSKEVSATDDDRKAADKNIVVQLRRVSDLSKGGEVEFKDGKKSKVSQKDAEKMLKGFDSLRKGPDKERFQSMAGKDLASMKRVLGMMKR